MKLLFKTRKKMKKKKMKKKKIIMKKKLKKKKKNKKKRKKRKIIKIQKITFNRDIWIMNKIGNFQMIYKWQEELKKN